MNTGNVYLTSDCHETMEELLESIFSGSKDEMWTNTGILKKRSTQQ